MTQASVLVVEDEAIVAADLAAKLARLGYRVLGPTDTGEEALRLAARERPSLVLMDIRLAGEMNGIEAAAVLRRDWDLPVVFLTAHSEPAMLERAGAVGALGYILKPFHERDLRAQIAISLDRHAADRRVRASEERYRDLYENAPNAYVSVGAEDGRIRMCNRAAELMFGYDRESLLGRSVLDLYADAAEGRDRARAAFERFRRGESIRDVELQVKHKDGSPAWVSLSVEPVRDAEGRVVESRSIVVDITERKRSELELRRLNESLEEQVAERTRRLRTATSELLLAEEHERRQLASEIHDNLGQELALARLKLSGLTRAVAIGDIEAARAEGEMVASLIQQANRSTRMLVRQIGPRSLYHAGLVPAVRELAVQLQEMHALQVDTTGLDERADVADQPTRVILYRAIRELLFNVAKHAGCKEASVSITRRDGRIRATVRDAGVGFDPGAASEGSGLLRIRERIESFVGTMRIESRPGAGTKVIIEVPLS